MKQAYMIIEKRIAQRLGGEVSGSSVGAERRTVVTGDVDGDPHEERAGS
jgi:hypothetical protein